MPITRSDAQVFVLVLGKAKTGTTFLSKMIQQALAPCEYVLEPKAPEFSRYLFECKWRDNAVVKVLYEHWDGRPNLRRALLANEFPVRFDKQILILRDPRDELISRLLYIVKPLKDQGRLTAAQLDEWLTLLRKKECEPSSISVSELVSGLDRIFGTRFLYNFHLHLKDFSHFYKHLPANIHVVKYEDLVDGRLESLESYLGFALDPEVAVDETIQRTRRSGTHGAWHAAFTTADVEALEPMMRDFMDQGGYAPAPPAGGTIQPAEWGDYVAALAER